MLKHAIVAGIFLIAMVLAGLALRRLALARRHVPHQRIVVPMDRDPPAP